MNVQGGGAANPNYCGICQVVCTGPRDFQVHLQGQRHARRQAASVAAPLISSSGGSFCTLCNMHLPYSSAGSAAMAMNDHNRSAWHLERLKTRVLEDRRLHGPLFSDKAGLSISSLGPVTQLQGASETMRLTIGNASGSLRVLRGVWQLSHVPQVSQHLGEPHAPGDNRLVSTTRSYHPHVMLAHGHWVSLMPWPLLDWLPRIKPAWCLPIWPASQFADYTQAILIRSPEGITCSVVTVHTHPPPMVQVMLADKCGVCSTGRSVDLIPGSQLEVEVTAASQASSQQRPGLYGSIQLGR